MTLIETAQEFERVWWGDCANTFGEEAKQLTYAPLMGLINTPRDGKWPVYDLEGKSVLDLGGGPCSMLLKTVNGSTRVVVDPCSFPVWVGTRYAFSGITHLRESAEEFRTTERFDECWIYNVLQHVVDPQRVIETATRYASVLRIFEWIDMPPAEGHPHTLKAHLLDEWIGGGHGKTQWVDLNGATGTCYTGTFAT